MDLLACRTVVPAECARGTGISGQACEVSEDGISKTSIASLPRIATNGSACCGGRVLAPACRSWSCLRSCTRPRPSSQKFRIADTPHLTRSMHAVRRPVGGTDSRNSGERQGQSAAGGTLFHLLSGRSRRGSLRIGERTRNDGFALGSRPEIQCRPDQRASGTDHRKGRPADTWPVLTAPRGLIGEQFEFSLAYGPMSVSSSGDSGFLDRKPVESRRTA